jgi:hypothetical protein
MRDLVFPDPVEQPDDLFDRDEAIREIDAALRGRTRRCVVILGGRLVGKTSLLNVVADAAERQLPWTVVRLAHTNTRAQFAAEIVEGIRHAVDPDRRPAAARFGGREAFRRAGREAFQFSTVVEFVQLAEGLAGRAPDRRFLLLIDEFDSLLQGCSEVEGRQILDLVLHLIEHTRLPIRFVVTMAEVPQRVRNSYPSPFVNQSTIVELEPWHRRQADQFVEWLAGGSPVLTEPARRAVYEAAGGHPYLTKAVLAALPAGSTPDDPVPVVAVQRAAAAAARSPEVMLALSNIEALLPDPAVRLLDRVAGSRNGLAAKEIREFTGPQSAAELLVRRGMLTADGGRYRLRLGLWRLWRGADAGERSPDRPTRRLRLVPRWLGRRAILVVLLLLALTGLAALAGFGRFLGTTTDELAGCTGRGTGLHAQVSHPAHVSVADSQSLQITIINDAATNFSGTAVVIFPRPAAGHVDIRGANRSRLDDLGPGEQQTFEVAFTYRQPGRVVPQTAAGMPVQLRISASGWFCQPPPVAIPIAPVLHLGALRNAVFALVALFAVPLVVELVARRLAEGRAARRPAQRSARKPAGPPPDGGK